VILGALGELAVRERLLDDPDFEKRRIDFTITIAEDGKLLAIVSMRDDEGRGRETLVPRTPKRSVGISPGFLCDNAKYVLGLGEKPERDEKCRAAFAGQVEAAATETKDQGLAAVAAFYKRFAKNLAAILKQRPRDEWTGAELLAFSVEGDRAQFVHERKAARARWSAQREQADSGDPVRCLVTGKLAPAARLHGSIKRVPQAQTAGASLVSFNAPAFESHGRSQGDNAAVSREAADAYVIALNWLLEGTATRLHRYGVRLGDDAVTVFWTKKATPDFELFASLVADNDVTQAIRAAEAPWRGKRPATVDANAFYALTLSGNAARVVVRDWFESTMAEVKHNVLQFFDDLAIGRSNEAIPLRGLVDSLKSPGRILPPELSSRLFAAALHGTGFPRELLHLALMRIRLPAKESEAGLEAWRLRARTSVIKATLVRIRRGGGRKKEITVSLDTDNAETPYLLGRLFATLERLQAAALGDVNASIRDRYFASASTMPALVFPRLLKVSVHHAAKAGNTGRWLEKVKGEIVRNLAAERFPKLMTLEDQGLFAVGYYHQRDFFFTPKAERDGVATAENS
jgi:CRISPR-associated protein Csd1